MALIKCPECGQEISDKANNCINCGMPIKLGTDKGIIEKNQLIKKGLLQHLSM